jgi:hypothetical protein
VAVQGLRLISQVLEASEKDMEEKVEQLMKEQCEQKICNVVSRR